MAQLDFVSLKETKLACVPVIIQMVLITSNIEISKYSLISMNIV